MPDKQDREMIKKLINNLSINIDFCKGNYNEKLFLKIKDDYNYLTNNKESMNFITKIKFAVIRMKYEGMIKKLPYKEPDNKKGNEEHKIFSNSIGLNNYSRKQENSVNKEQGTIVISDLHGNMQKWNIVKKYIQKNPNMNLIILGDAVDRGTNGIKILLEIKELSEQGKALYLPGNHDVFAYNTLKAAGNSRLEQIFEDDISMWNDNGGKNTESQFLELEQQKMYELIEWWGKQPIQYKYSERRSKLCIITCNI